MRGIAQWIETGKYVHHPAKGPALRIRAL